MSGLRSQVSENLLKFSPWNILSCELEKTRRTYGI